jgi:hypothetical protein
MKKIRTVTAAAAAACLAAGCVTRVNSNWRKNIDGSIDANVSVISTGTQSEALAQGFDAGPEGSLLKDASGKQDSTAAVNALSQAVAALAPFALEAMAARQGAALPAYGGAQSAAAPAGDAASAATVAYAAEGYGGAPGAGGEGVYGRPGCPRCRAYAAAHPGVEIIDIDQPANSAAMWAALRARGYTGRTAALPVLIKADGYTLNAK